MTNVLVCVKRVPDVAGSVSLAADGMSIDARHVGYTISAHEECAVELAVAVAADTGGQVTVLSLGSQDATEQLRTALAMGAHDAVLIDADAEAFGPADVATAIAEVVRQREESGRPVELVLLGNDAADTGDFQVGIRLAHQLGRPVVAGVKQVAVAGTVATLTAESGVGAEVYEVTLPAVATVLEGGVTPRYPSMVGRMKAKKAPLEVVASSVTPRGTTRVGLSVPPPPPSEVVVLGEGPAAAPAVVGVLKQLGVVAS